MERAKLLEELKEYFTVDNSNFIEFKTNDLVFFFDKVEFLSGNVEKIYSEEPVICVSKRPECYVYLKDLKTIKELASCSVNLFTLILFKEHETRGYDINLLELLTTTLDEYNRATVKSESIIAIVKRFIASDDVYVGLNDLTENIELELVVKGYNLGSRNIRISCPLGIDESTIWDQLAKTLLLRELNYYRSGRHHMHPVYNLK